MNLNLRSGLVRLLLIVPVVAGMLAPAAVSAQRGAQGMADFSPGSGPPGTEVHVSISGWPSGRLTLLGDGEPLCTIRTGNNGRGECTFTVPRDSDGRLHLTITGENVSRSEIGVFRVTGGGGGDDRGGGNQNDRRSDTPPPPVPVPVPTPDMPTPDTGTSPVFPVVDSELLLALNETVGCSFAILGAYKGGPPAVLHVLQQPPCTDVLQAGFGPALTLVQCMEVYSFAVCVGLPTNVEPLPQPPLEVAPDFPLPECIPGQTGTVTDCAENPSPRPQPAPVVPPIVPEDLPTYGDVLDSLENQPAAPSASLVQDQHDQIRGDVCASVPAGAGGCP